MARALSTIYQAEYSDVPESIGEMMKQERFEAGNGERIDQALLVIEEVNGRKRR